MGWVEIFTRRNEKTRDIVARQYLGDPDACDDCGWRSRSHPRVKGSEDRSLDRATLPPPHAHRPPVPRYRLLDYSQVGWTTAYLALETIATGEVWAGVCLIRRTVNTLGLKALTETSGPAEDRCPARILDRLSPTTDEYALRWRERCRERIAGRTYAPKVRAGDHVRFAQPITFTDGIRADQLAYSRGSTFTREDGVRCRISNWRERPWRLVPPDFSVRL